MRPVNTPPHVLKEVWVEAGGGVAGQGRGGWGGERWEPHLGPSAAWCARKPWAG